MAILVSLLNRVSRQLLAVLVGPAKVTAYGNADQDKQSVHEWRHQLVDGCDPGQGSRDSKELDPAPDESEGEQYRGNKGKINKGAANGPGIRPSPGQTPSPALSSH